MFGAAASGQNPKAMQVAQAYKHHARFVKRTLRRFGVRCSDADDALQLVFLVVYRRFDEYAEVLAQRAWLFMVSKLVSSNYHRGLRRARVRRLGYVVPPAPELEELLFRREAGRMVMRFLGELEEPERRAFCLANFEGLTAREIALELDMNMNTVYTRLRSARMLFERRLARRGRRRLKPESRSALGACA